MIADITITWTNSWFFIAMGLFLFACGYAAGLRTLDNYLNDACTRSYMHGVRQGREEKQ